LEAVMFAGGATDRLTVLAPVTTEAMEADEGAGYIDGLRDDDDANGNEAGTCGETGLTPGAEPLDTTMLSLVALLLNVPVTASLALATLTAVEEFIAAGVVPTLMLLLATVLMEPLIVPVSAMEALPSRVPSPKPATVR
jgi:hypothetical protein